MHAHRSDRERKAAHQRVRFACGHGGVKTGGIAALRAAIALAKA